MKIYSILEHGLSDEVFTACEALVGYQGRIVWHKRVGRIFQNSKFDLSSLTKPIVISALALRLQSEGVLSLDQKVSDFFSTKTLESVTLHELLEHRSSLVDWHSFFPKQLMAKKPTFRKNKTQILDKILNDKKLVLKNHNETVYSDLGFMLLGAILEKATKQRLENLFYQKMLEPLNLQARLHYLPLRGSAHKPKFYVPSGTCLKRQRLLQAEVQDQNCYVMGGVSGHAGLFGQAGALHEYLQQLRLARDKESKIFPHESYQALCEGLAVKVARRHRFVYGFDTVDKNSRNFGSHFSRQDTLCHLGFSGVSFVWDFSKDIWVILLTNRGIFGLENPKIYAFRKKFHDAVMAEFAKIK